MVEKNLKPGTIVWCNTHDIIEKCKIIEYCEKEDISYYELQSLTLYGSFGSLLDHLFLSEEEAKKDRIQRSEKYKKELENKIKTPIDLFELMLQNMHGEEYTDYEAIAVSKEKIKEFFNIEL